MNVVHLGGTREPLTDEQIGELGEVDILFVPVGGGDVLAPGPAADLVSRIEPRVVIPMHYKDDGLSLKADGVEKFIKASGLKAENVDKLKLAKKDLPQDDTKLYVLARS
jgi:L-ascorbate metabolism protein UlaG (beta-lactamase superfamily)